MDDVAEEVGPQPADGCSIAEIAVERGVTRDSVEYHAKRRARPADAHTASTSGARPPARERMPTRDAIRTLLADGHSRAETARRLGLSRPTVSYHARLLGEAIDERGARRYDWRAVQRYYDDHHTVADCVAAFGFSKQTWYAAVKRGAVVGRPTALPMSELCVAGSDRSRNNLKRRLLASGVREPRCAVCATTDWRGRPLSLALHHRNGDGRDNRLENLELLCPNCHSQTETFAGRNHRRTDRPGSPSTPDATGGGAS